MRENIASLDSQALLKRNKKYTAGTATSFLCSKSCPVLRFKADKPPHLMRIVCTNPIFGARNHFEQHSG